MKKIAISFLCFISVSSYAANTTFKVTSNNPNDYGEESFQIKTTKGQLAIYSMNLSLAQDRVLSSLKKGDCVLISTPEKLEKSDGYYFIDQINSVKKVACPK